MQYRLLGRSGLKVSAMTMGTMTFTHARESPVGAVGLDEAKRQIDLCLDHGVNMIDTANVYSSGESEDIIGQALGRKRGDVLDRHQGALPDGPGAERPRQLPPSPDRRLRGEPQAAAHRLDRPLSAPPVGRRDAARGDAGGARPSRLVRQGPLHRLLELLRLAHHEGARRRRSGSASRASSRQQIHYTLQAREAEYELVPISIAEGLGILVWSPIAGGLLSGKFRRGEKRTGGRPSHPRPAASRRSATRTALFDIVDVLVDDRRRARRLRRAGGARLAARPARGHDRHHRRPQRGAVQGQPRRAISSSPRRSGRRLDRSASRPCSTRTGTSSNGRRGPAVRSRPRTPGTVPFGGARWVGFPIDHPRLMPG